MLEQHMLEHTTSIPKESVKNESQENSKNSKMWWKYSGVVFIVHLLRAFQYLSLYLRILERRKTDGREQKCTLCGFKTNKNYM